RAGRRRTITNRPGPASKASAISTGRARRWPWVSRSRTTECRAMTRRTISAPASSAISLAASRRSSTNARSSNCRSNIRIATDFYAPLYLTPPGDAHSSDYRLAGFGSIAWLAGVTKQLTPNFSAQIAAERSYRRAGLRSGGIGIDADNYIWTLYLVTLQARF